MNIQLKLQDHTHLESYSQFELGVGYAARANQPWSVYIVKANPHIRFRHEGVVGYGATLEEAVATISNELSTRLHVALESRHSFDHVQERLRDIYDHHNPATDGSVMRMTAYIAFMAAAKTMLFENGYTIYSFRAAVRHQGVIDEKWFKVWRDRVASLAQGSQTALGCEIRSRLREGWSLKIEETGEGSLCTFRYRTGTELKTKNLADAVVFGCICEPGQNKTATAAIPAASPGCDHAAGKCVGHKASVAPPTDTQDLGSRLTDGWSLQTEDLGNGKFIMDFWHRDGSKVKISDIATAVRLGLLAPEKKKA